MDVRSTDDPRIVAVHINLSNIQLPVLRSFSADEAVEYVISAVHGGPSDDLGRAFDAVKDENWRAFQQILEAAAGCENVSAAFSDALHLDWTVRGFSHRAKIADDALFIRAFRRVFTPYSGGSLELFRGESAEEFDAERIGLNWTPLKDIAAVFARRWNIFSCDGVLLVATVEPPAIITGPNDHSANWLGEVEYIVDPQMLGPVAEVERYPADSD